MVKNISKLVLLTVSICLLTGCKKPTLLPETPPELPTSYETETTRTEHTCTEPTNPTTFSDPVTTPTEPEHSPFYIPGLSVEDVTTYFNEVCMDAEIVNDGDASFLQKWSLPVHYALNGSPTEEDLEQLSQFTSWLNTVEGFPGISEATENDEVNLRIHFCSYQEMLDLLGENFEDMDAGVTFWYSDDEIYDAIICYRTDLSQEVRNSVILEEIYNGLGPIQDTALRSDSIIYSEFTTPQALSPIDELILKLLYHPSLSCGMTAEEAAAAIRKLYY